ncbi:OLC1v1033578C1 [Oldenlandia corymbosa var. corymbosa]|uniref:Protein SCAR n=1 Tax=Oldenlandia corymbosa var. corymbosa TaxID=529605 RepID=A0AAV1CNF6_OLDCO|nr:OLC1v1033578C1 [Oldenlandia corymbosa var. corymbosa]
MPLCRYQIRNEYSLADPELYRAADKDDPEALLEGIAMAGLVGVLRQLGDLAEFAAEIFHDLHEQVMATASRGHSLMVRVQQLEAEFPTIEKAFLSQTNHSSFYYNYGTDWHPNLHMDQNVITQGDLPRFVMDSYEECRGPPRLFLLDKFDVAGAGACLKRYTDPSFFKLETSYPDTVRDKKIRKAKRKGPRWKNGETPEPLSTSHAKLHQLFLQERIENGTLNSAGRVKLKRRLNGFPFDTKSGKSYMEKFLKPPSPDHNEVHVIPEDLSPPSLPPNSNYESACEVVEISVITPLKEPKQFTRSPILSPAREETTLELAGDELNEVSSSGEGSVDMSKPKLGCQAYETSSTSHVVSRENDIQVDGGSKTEDSIDENQSDDVASEIDNFVDALATMESDIETDSELRSKTDLRSVSSRGQASNVDDANDVLDQAHSAESVSTGNSTSSDDGSSSSKKELCSFSYSDAYSTSAENIHFDCEVSSNVMTSKIHEGEPSLIRKSVDAERDVAAPLKDTAYDGSSILPKEVPEIGFELDVPVESSTPNGSVLHENAEAVMKDTASVSSDIDDMEVPSAADVCNQKGDSLPAKSAEILDDYENVDATKIHDKGLRSPLSTPSASRYDLTWQVQSETNFLNESDDEDAYQDKNAVGSDADENFSSSNAEIEPLDQLLDGEKPFSATNRSDPLLYNGDQVSPENLPLNDFGVEEPNYDPNISVGVSDIVEAFTEKNVTDNLFQIPSEDEHLESVGGLQNSDLQLSEEHLSSPINEELEMDSSGIEVDERISEVDNSIPAADAPVSSELVGSRNLVMEAYVQPIDLVGGQTLQLTDVCCDDPLSVGDGETVNEEAASCLGVIESNGTSSLAEVHDHLKDHDESATATATISDLDHENDGFPFDALKKLEVASISSFREEHSGLEVDTSISNKPGNSSGFNDVDDLRTVVTDNIGLQICEKDGPLVSESESGLDIDEMPPTQKFTLASKDNFLDAVIDDNIGSQISDDDGGHLVMGAENGLNIGETPTTQKLSGGENELNTVEMPTSPSVEPYENDPDNVEEDIDLQLNSMDSNLHCKSDDDLALSTGLQQAVFSDLDYNLRTFDTSENTSSCQSSASEQLSLGNKKIDSTEHYSGPPNPASLPFPVLPDPGQIYLEEMPPLPPLPPVQWRMGKFQNSSQARESIMGLTHANIAFPPPPLSSIVNGETYNLNPFLPPVTLSNEKSTPLPEQSVDCSSSSFCPSEVEPGEQKKDILPQEGYQVTETLSQSHRSESEKRGAELNPSMDSIDQTYVTDGAHLPSSSHEELIKPPNQMVQEASPSNVELAAHSVENMVTCDTSEISVKVTNENVIPTSEEHLSPPSAEDGITNSNRTLKLPRPRNPLIDAVVALDKSKLRKVPERIKPQVEKEDERDSLLQLRKVPERIKPQVQKDDERDSWLEQIRTKSFNLKPAVITRPSIHQGPNTNLRVAAILEKAKTIRQAFAGSDEDDDDDSWSDS